MSWFSRIRNVFRSNRLSDELDRELSFHLTERTDDLVAHGLNPEAARREARRRFGNYGMQKEAARDRDIFPSLDSLIGDLRYAFRALRTSPGFALVAILSLGLGIGANTAIFSLINAVMLRSLPVTHPEELLVVTREQNEYLTNPIWEYTRDHQDVFSRVFAYGLTSFNLSTGGEARPVSANWVSGGYFTTLGVRAVKGRTLMPSDDIRGCAGVAAISDIFWQTEYGGRLDVVGKTISLDGHPFQIVGIIDPAFYGLDVGARAQIFAPLCAQSIIEGSDEWIDARSRWYLQIVGRIKEGLTPTQAAARLDMLSPGLAEATTPPNFSAQSKESYRNAHFDVENAAKGFSELRATFRKALYVLMGVVSVVLLIACANVANLLLARATARQREIAVRLALGAGRARLIRQLLTESLLLSTLGAALGVLFAVWGSRLLVHMMSTTNRAVVLDLSVDMRVLAFTAAVATLTGLLFGLSPAWRAGRVDPQVAMKSQARGIAEGHSRFSAGKTLVVGQIALSLVLVVAAALLLGSWRRLATANPGFTSDQILLMNVDVRSGHPTAADRRIFFKQMLDRLRTIPGVASASASELTPVGRAAWNSGIKADGFAPASWKDAVVWVNEVSDSYFAALGTPMRFGRDFGVGDTPSTPKVAIINEAMAKQIFGSVNAIGKHFQMQQGPGYGSPIEVVGIVANAKYRSLRATDEPIVYLAFNQNSEPDSYLSFEIRGAGSAPPSTLVLSLKAVAGQMDSRMVVEFVPLGRQLAESLRLPRTLATLSGFFGGLALLLAMIGLYGIMSYSVARRRNEIGIRIALGAAQVRVVRMVIAEVVRLVIAGLVIGALITIATTRLVTSFLYGVTPTDPATITMSAALLLLVGVVAAMTPALRAARLDPIAALREE